MFVSSAEVPLRDCHMAGNIVSLHLTSTHKDFSHVQGTIKKFRDFVPEQRDRCACSRCESVLTLVSKYSMLCDKHWDLFVTTFRLCLAISPWSRSL